MTDALDMNTLLSANSWPFQEAKKLKERIEKTPPEKGYVLFETGYGPSGLPHIGTFGEVFRTTMVRQAFARISHYPTRLIAFSDDMDGLRKVPDNVPNPKLLEANLGKPLTEVPDPFEQYDSFAAHNNAKLREFLDQFGFAYEFKSATECYRSGEFDEALLAALKQYDAIMKIMLPTLGEERQQTYSPFMPIDPETRQVLQVKTLETRPEQGTIIYEHPEHGPTETKVTGGAVKLQWKPDWGMRWAALGVDYEMHGKDLTPSVVVSSKIARVLLKEMYTRNSPLTGEPENADALSGGGGIIQTHTPPPASKMQTPPQGGSYTLPEPPLTYVYEMFLDEKGEKISKSKGNGISLEDWLSYGTPESLALYMFNNPRKAKRLYFDVIPQHVDEYLKHLQAVDPENHVKLLLNPVWHIHNGEVPEDAVPITFSLLLNLASACNPEDKSVLWGFITRYQPDAMPETHKLLDELVEYAIAYYEDFVKPHKEYHTLCDKGRAIMEDMKDRLRKVADPNDPAELQQVVLDTAKAHGFEKDTMRDAYKLLYRTLFGQESGPRMGSFIALYGVEETIGLIDEALARTNDEAA